MATAVESSRAYLDVPAMTKQEYDAQERRTGKPPTIWPAQHYRRTLTIENTTTITGELNARSVA